MNHRSYINQGIQTRERGQGAGAASFPLFSSVLPLRPHKDHGYANEQPWWLRRLLAVSNKRGPCKDLRKLETHHYSN